MPPASSSMARRVLGLVGGALERPLFLGQACARSAVVLVYHRVSPDADPFYPPTHPDLFKEQLDLIQAHYAMLPLDEIVARLQTGRSLRGCCAVTFDDGFADFAEHAYPILRERRIPVTHFLTTQGLLTGRPTWNYRLNRVLHYLRLSDDLAHAPRDTPSPTTAELMRAKRRFDLLSVEKREALLDRLERLAAPPPDPPILRPPDLRRIDGTIVQWGSHTVTHATLPACERSRLRFELAKSRETLENVLGERVRFLAYPNADYDEATMSVAAECGYVASFTAHQKRVRPGTPLHAIPRFDIGGLPRNMVGLELARVTPLLRRLLRGRKERRD